MNRWFSFLGIAIALCTSSVMAVQIGNNWSSAGVLDTRTSFGGRVIYGDDAFVAPRNASTSENNITIDGTAPEGWSISNPYWDTTTVEDGRHNAVNDFSTVRLTVQNAGDIVFHGGLLTHNETWGAGLVHVIQYNTRVPAGITLTIAQGAIVKFCEGTQLQVDEETEELPEGRLIVYDCTITHIADDTAGGDTNLDGDYTSPKLNRFSINIDGDIQAKGIATLRYIGPSAEAKIYTLTPHNCSADNYLPTENCIFFAGTTVFLTATPIANWPETETVVSWSSDPELTISADEEHRLDASFIMPAMDVEVTASATKQLYTITTNNCTANATMQSAGELVTLTANLPAPQEEYTITWTAEPDVTIIEDLHDRSKATFAMPAENVQISCTVERKTYQLTVVNGFAIQDNRKIMVLDLLKNATVTLYASIDNDIPPEDYLIEWYEAPEEENLEPYVDSFSTINKNKRIITYTMPNHDVTITADIKQYYYVTPQDCTVNVTRALSGATLHLTASIPAGEPAEEYTVEWRSAPAIVITADADNHTKATFEMPEEDIAITCVFTRKLYPLTVVNGFAIKADEEYTTIELAKDERVTIVSAPYDIEAWTRMNGWTTEDADATVFEDASSSITTLTMPNTPVTIQSNYEEMPYLPEDSDKDKILTLHEYTEAKDLLKTNSLNGYLCYVDENGNTVFMEKEAKTFGTEGDYVRRTVNQLYYAEGSVIEVTIEIPNASLFTSFAILEELPDSWQWGIALHEDGTIINPRPYHKMVFDVDIYEDVNGFPRKYIWTLSDELGNVICTSEPTDGSIPQRMTYYITPKNGEELTDSITLHAPQAVGYIYGSYAEMNVEDSILTYTPAHGADANRDLLLTMKEICDYRAKLMKIILHTGEYVWDGSEFIPYPLMENTRGTGEEEIFTMARQLSATSFELGSLLTVTLDLSPFAGATMLSFSDKIPSGWSVTDAGGGQLAKDGSSLLFDYDIGETIPNSVTYTLQAPKLYAEPEYILALDSFKGIMDGDTITAQIADTPLQWRTPTPSLTVYSSGHLAKWRMNNGEWLPSGTPVSLAKGTPATLEVQLPEGNYLFGEWYALSNAVSLATPQEASISFTMPDESIVLKAKLLSAQNLALTDGWNLLAKTAEMSASPDFANQKVFILNQNTYCKVAFEKVPMAGVFWLYSANSSTKTFYYESVPNTYDYCPSIIGSGWQCIGSPDARLNCVLKPEDADNLFFWQKGMWHHCDNPAIDSRPLEAEQGYFLFK